MSRRAFVSMFGLAGLTVGGGIYAANRFSLLTNLMDYFGLTDPVIKPEIAMLGPNSITDFRYEVDSYAQGVWIDQKRLLLPEIGASQQLYAAMGRLPKLMEEAHFSSSDESVAFVDEFGLVTARGFGSCVIKVGDQVNFDTCLVDVKEKWVSLTFDDGPMDKTWRLLDGLRERNVRADFFVLGNMAEARLDLLAQMAEDGHQIGNHSYNHKGDVANLHSQMETTDGIIASVLGHPAHLMRPPGGTINSATYSCGKPIILWSVDPVDWQVRDEDAVYRNVMRDTFSGSVVLMHDIYETTIDAAFRAIDSLKDNGYYFVTVAEMFEDLQPGVIYRTGPSKPRQMCWANPAWPLPR